MSSLQPSNDVSRDTEAVALTSDSSIQGRPYAPYHLELFARATLKSNPSLFNAKEYFPIPGRTLLPQYVHSRTTWNSKPPVLYYGIPISSDSLPVYALRKQEADPDDIPLHTTLKGLAALRRACKKRFFTESPRVAYSREYDQMLGLYTNYDMHEKRVDEQTENAFFDQVRAELRLDPDLPAMWFFSLDSEWNPTYDQKDWDDVKEYGDRYGWSSDEEEEGSNSDEED